MRKSLQKNSLLISIILYALVGFMASDNGEDNE